jgi:hypothetical protein
MLTVLFRITVRNGIIGVESRHLVDIERACESVVPSGKSCDPGQGGRVTEVHLHIEQQTLPTGRPVVVWPGQHALYAAYDPAQLDEAQAVETIRLCLPGMPDFRSATRTSDGRRAISTEDIAEHGRPRRTGNSSVSTAYKEV